MDHLNVEITLPLDHIQIGFTLENFYSVKKLFNKNSNKVKSVKGNSYRFLDFAPPSPDLYQSSYTDYVASVFKNEPFNGGGTYTADALEQVRIEDIPLARNDSIKYVMVFTDGASSDRYLLPNETFLLQSVVDKVYGFGGPGETVETFFREIMASCFGHQSLTIARGRGGKYPSQREQWQLHGEVGDR